MRLHMDLKYLPLKQRHYYHLSSAYAMPYLKILNKASNYLISTISGRDIISSIVSDILLLILSLIFFISFSSSIFSIIVNGSFSFHDSISSRDLSSSPLLCGANLYVFTTSIWGFWFVLTKLSTSLNRLWIY